MSKRFRKLADAYKDMIYTFALYSLRREEDAEDVTQEVLVKLWQNADDIAPDRARAWVMRVTRNAVIDTVRRRRTRASVIAEEVDAEMAANYAAAGAVTDTVVENRELREALEDALSAMDEPYRTIIVMREIQEMSYQEIAGALEMPLGTVKVYLHRGRRMLREALGTEHREV